MSQGYIPIIADKFGVWDQFFEQPVMPIEEGKSVDDYPVSDVDFTMHTASGVDNNNPLRKTWAKLLKDFCRLKPNEKNYIESEIKEVLGKGKRVLGVVCRGTDYVGTGMPTQPSIEMLSSDIKDWMQKYNYDKVYLATEDERIFNALSKELPDVILTNKRTYYDKKLAETNQKWIGTVSFDRENDRYYRGLEYYSSINILSRCNALLAGFCGATGIALMLNNEKYERFHVYDLGISRDESESE